MFRVNVSLVSERCTSGKCAEESNRFFTSKAYSCLSNERCCWKCAHSKKLLNFEHRAWQLVGCYLHPEVGQQSFADAVCNDYLWGSSKDEERYNKENAEKLAKEQVKLDKERADILYSSFGYIE